MRSTPWNTVSVSSTIAVLNRPRGVAAGGAARRRASRRARRRRSRGTTRCRSRSACATRRTGRSGASRRGATAARPCGCSRGTRGRRCAPRAPGPGTMRFAYAIAGSIDRPAVHLARRVEERFVVEERLDALDARGRAVRVLLAEVARAYREARRADSSWPKRPPVRMKLTRLSWRCERPRPMSVSSCSCSAYMR